jgi:hypothetical protein
MNEQEWTAVGPWAFGMFGSANPTPQTARSYFDVLQSHDVRDVVNAVRTFVEQGRAFLPSAPEWLQQATLEGAPAREWGDGRTPLGLDEVQALMRRPFLPSPTTSERGVFDPPPMRKLPEGDR